jgi:acetyl esterase/lipase
MMTSIANVPFFCYTDFMSSLRNYRAAAKKLRLLSYSSKTEVEPFRSRIEKKFCAPVLPNHVEVSERDFGGVTCDLLEPELYSSRRIMIYVHGGSFIGGSRFSWRQFCAAQAHADSCRIVVPEYRLAPRYAFPSALEDLQAVFKAVYTDEQVARSLDTELTGDTEILIGADSAGASIALALVLNLRERFRKCIRQIVLFSPWLNISADSSLLAGKSMNDGVVNSDCIRRSGDLYTYETNLSNPLVSPVKCRRENLKYFPPVYIQAGGKEAMLPDAEQFRKLLLDAGVACVLDVWPDLPPLFQMADEYFPESHLAVEKVGNLITGRSSDRGKIVAEGCPALERSLTAEA